MSNFPKLIPAFTAQIVIAAPSTVGAVARGAPLTIVPFAPNEGYLRSEPNYPISVDAVFLHGSDFIRKDPSNAQIRLDVNSYLQDKKSEAIIVYKYTGIINVTEGVANVLGGKPEKKTTPFGNAFTHVVFETGNEELKGLESKVFVASGRFIVEGEKTIVEYKISEVTSS